MALFVLLLLFWYPIVAQADISASGCDWSAKLSFATLPPAPTGTVQISGALSYQGINCTSTLTGECTLIFGEIGYSASPITFTMQPATASTSERVDITFNYPQLPSSTLAVLEGPSSEFILVDSQKIYFNVSGCSDNDLRRSESFRSYRRNVVVHVFTFNFINPLMRRLSFNSSSPVITTVVGPALVDSAVL
jgi:hypothetical protein